MIRITLQQKLVKLFFKLVNLEADSNNPKQLLWLRKAVIFRQWKQIHCSQNRLQQPPPHPRSTNNPQPFWLPSSIKIPGRSFHHSYFSSILLIGQFWRKTGRLRPFHSVFRKIYLQCQLLSAADPALPSSDKLRDRRDRSVEPLSSSLADSVSQVADLLAQPRRLTHVEVHHVAESRAGPV